MKKKTECIYVEVKVEFVGNAFAIQDAEESKFGYNWVTSGGLADVICRNP